MSKQDIVFSTPHPFSPSREFQTSPFLLKNLNSASVRSAGSTFFLNFLYLCSHYRVSWHLTWTDPSNYKGLTWLKSEKHYLLFRREPSWYHSWGQIGYVLQITFCIDSPAQYVHPSWCSQDLQYEVVVFSGIQRIAIRRANCLRSTVYFSLGRRTRKH